MKQRHRLPDRQIIHYSFVQAYGDDVYGVFHALAAFFRS